MRNYLKSFNVLSDEEIGTLEKMVRKKTLKKGEFFVKAGNTCNEVAFVASGILRSFYYSSNSDEITFCFTFENAFMTAYSSLISNSKTNENIEALSDVELYVFTREQLLQLENSSMNWLKFSKMMAQQEYIRLEKRIFILQKESAETRYDDLLTHHPEYLTSIPLTYLASYLGISQRHLSRLRKLRSV